MSTTKESFYELLDSVKTLTFLTGAGVSTDSGVPDFKTIDDNWDFPVSRVEATSLSFFNRNPLMFWEGFRYLFTLKTEVTPNLFHRSVALLEKTHDVTVLTQNIDGLHQKAGSSNVTELHGNLRDVVCNRKSCDYREPLTIEHNEKSRCPKCRKLLRPDVVLFGEIPRHVKNSQNASVNAGLLLVAGTALEVSPVNEFPRLRELHFPERDAVWINRDRSPAGYIFRYRFQDELALFAELVESYVADRTKESSANG